MSKPALGRGLGALLGGAKPKPASDPVPASTTPAAALTSAATSNPIPPSDSQKTSGLTSVASNSPVSKEVQARTVQLAAIARVIPSPLQPRKEFASEALQELAESIRSNGILQPLLVRAVGDHLELIAGERRWRAAQLAGLNEVPVLIRVATDAEVLEMALIENLQRENLNPIEEALGYQQLQAAFRLTQEQIAAKVGRGRVVVANAMRLLKLPPNVQTALKEGQLSVGHAKVLLGIADPTLQIQAAKQVIAKGLTVRQTEDFVARLQAPPPPPTQPPTVSVPDPHVLDMENRLRERFTAKVALRYQAGKGSVELRFHNDEELHRLLALLGVSVD